eukprot:1215292-Prymnesium_polylepis.1
MRGVPRRWCAHRASRRRSARTSAGPRCAQTARAPAILGCACHMRVGMPHEGCAQSSPSTSRVRRAMSVPSSFVPAARMLSRSRRSSISV